ncbi:hypothetical protein FJZ18_00485 [Candidatus Pacearchaeota archaeon]|nr:hypothetical protein [Candidatus Pacearchaeota archaeon]
MSFIDQISVYNPGDEGHTKKTMLALPESGAEILIKSIHDKALRGIVDGGTTLDDYLYGERGYFQRNKGIYKVIFVRGRLHNAMTRKETSQGKSLDHIADKCDDIPLIFCKANTKQ